MTKSSSVSIYRRLLLGFAILLVSGVLVQLVFRNGHMESQSDKDGEYTQDNKAPTSGNGSIVGVNHTLSKKTDPQWLLDLPESTEFAGLQPLLQQRMASGNEILWAVAQGVVHLEKSCYTTRVNQSRQCHNSL